MNLREKNNYLNNIIGETSSIIRKKLPNLSSIYVDTNYFNDASEISNVPTPLYFVVEDKPRNSIEIEQELNILSGYFLSFILDEVEFDNNFKCSSTLVESF